MNDFLVQVYALVPAPVQLLLLAWIVRELRALRKMHVATDRRVYRLEQHAGIESTNPGYRVASHG